MSSAFSASVKYTPYGLAFSPYTGTQDPNTGITLSTNQVGSRLRKLKGSAEWVRTYSTTHGMETAGAQAHGDGFKIAQEAWLGPQTDATGLAANSQELANLTAAANRGEVDMAIVGSEAVLRGDLTVLQLLTYIRQVRAAIPTNIPVTTDESYGVLLDNPILMQGCDVVMANIYPYWESVRIDGAVAAMDGHYKDLVTASEGKKVIIGEAGWPSAGTSQGDAVCTPVNAAYHFWAVNSWAQDMGVDVMYFDAFDELWKAPVEGSQGSHWGIRTGGGSLKPGMNLVYGGYKLPPAVYLREPTLSTGPTTGGGSTPEITMTQIPAYGGSAYLEGVVSGVSPGSYAVAVYLYVGGWWTKPTFADPLTSINANGSFSCDVDTGGIDYDATQYGVFVVPNTYSPPAEGGDASLPAALYSSSVVYTNISRPEGYPGYDSSGGSPLLAITSFSLNRNFDSQEAAQDKVVIAGKLPLQGGSPVGDVVQISVGSANWTFEPIAKDGSAMSSDSNMSGGYGKLSVHAGAQCWNYSARLYCNAGGTNWNAQGACDATMPSPGIPVFMPVGVFLGGSSYELNAKGAYRAKAGVSGQMSGTSMTVQ
jgi:exo-beta-1,3-glucanase (GH17 family)